jgi:hypothetical protein
VGIPFTEVRSLRGLDPARDELVIGADAWTNTLTRGKKALKDFVSAGGRVLMLRQDPTRFDGSWLPTPIELQTEPLDHPLVYPPGRPYRNGMAVNPERPDHPVFAGLDRDRFFLWSDWTGWNESRTGFPQVYPVTRGFVLTGPDALAHTAILADYGHGLQGVALAEMFSGKGSIVLSGFDLVDRAGLFPVADRLLVNLVRYQASAAGHEAYPLVRQPIVWGDYQSEHGLVVGVYNGLIVNGVPVVPEPIRAKYPLHVDEKEGWQIAGAGGGWNTRPAIQYVARGRRPYGPYGFSIGGSPTMADDAGPQGSGTVWMRVPDGRKEMLTTVWNPADAPLELEIGLNGATQRASIPAHGTISVNTPLNDAGDSLAVRYRGDRRLVLLRTEFR